MRPPDTLKDRVVASAARGAATQARWQSRDLLSRRSLDAAPDLLRGQAAEMAFSPHARDQILSLALSAAAAELERGGATKATGLPAFLDGPAPSEAARLVVRGEVFHSGPLRASASRKVADAIERRHRPDCRSRREIAERLREDAALHTLLWDDPRLPCDSRTRLLMLFSIPKLLDRADHLDPIGAGPPGRPSLLARLDPRPAIRRLLSQIPTGWLVSGSVVAALFALSGLEERS